MIADSRNRICIREGTVSSQLNSRKSNGSETVASKLTPQTKPDAPLTRISRMVTAAIHASILAGVVLFVIWQLVMAATSQKRVATVKLVASDNKQLSAPCDGVFHAAAGLPVHVKQGQRVGHIVSVPRDKEIASLREEIADLRRQRLMLRSVTLGHSDVIADYSRRLRLAKIRVEELTSVGKRRDIFSPVNGMIELRLSGSPQSVKKNDSIAQVWEPGDDLLIEVEGPIEVIKKIIRNRKVTAKFVTHQGTCKVTATTIEGSVKPFDRSDGQVTKIWGLVQCRPDSLPAELATPGTLGRL